MTDETTKYVEEIRARLQCLREAASIGQEDNLGEDAIVEIAEKFYKFVKG